MPGTQITQSTLLFSSVWHLVACSRVVATSWAPLVSPFPTVAAENVIGPSLDSYFQVLLH